MSTNVVNFPFQPHTYDQISEELRRTEGRGEPLSVVLPQYPEMMEHALNSILSGFNYNDNKQSPIAVGCRMLVAMIDHLKSNLKTLDDSDQYYVTVSEKAWLLIDPGKKPKPNQIVAVSGYPLREMRYADVKDGQQVLGVVVKKLRQIQP